MLLLLCLLLGLPVRNLSILSDSTTYGFSGDHRVRRSSDSNGDVPDWSIPSDYEEEHDSSDHIYYVMNITSSESQLNKHFVNIDEMLKKEGVLGNSSHPLLSGSYRRAVGVKLSFDFPFYGYYMKNLTIATGGFIYIGDQAHNWLAATQYIAPLMANFETSQQDSNIIYADDGQKFVVEWRKVQLRGQSEHGQFTFQVILHKNGDIVFAYKDVPMDVSNISDSSHPVKLGISDAYLVSYTAKPGTTTPKRIIYEYHRIEIPPGQVSSNAVVHLEAQPTCVSLNSCETCTNATLKNFVCSWCRTKDQEHFCTDQAGLNRKRQHWIEGKCADRPDKDVCDNVEFVTMPSKSSTTSPAPATESASIQEETKGFSFFVFFLGTLFCVGAWLAYAYYNPHTTSGQFLIKHRPSRWHVPSSHVRYSASVHM